MEFMGNFTIPSSTTNRCSQVRWKIQKIGRARINRKSFKGQDFAIITTKNGEGGVSMAPSPPVPLALLLPKTTMYYLQLVHDRPYFPVIRDQRRILPPNFTYRPGRIFSNKVGANPCFGHHLPFPIDIRVNLSAINKWGQMKIPNIPICFRRS